MRRNQSRRSCEMKISSVTWTSTWMNINDSPNIKSLFSSLSGDRARKKLFAMYIQISRILGFPLSIRRRKSFVSCAPSPEINTILT
jgi:hypothetical protein